MKRKIEIEVDEYRELLLSEARLFLLEQGGVENWAWYRDSLKGLMEEEKKIEKLISKLLGE